MFTAVPSKVSGDVFTEAMYDTYVRDNLDAGVMRPVAGSVLLADAASFTFSGVSAVDFATLVALIEVRSTVAAASSNWTMRFNDDAGANYSYGRVWGKAAVVSSDVTLSAVTSIVGLNIPGGTAPAGVFGLHVVTFQNLAAGRQRACHWLAGSKFGNATNSAYCGVNVAKWANTVDDVTSITFAPAAGDFAAGSKFHLYGVGAI